MEQQTLPGLPERNPKTHAAHRREVWWQITFPFLIVLLIFVVLVVGVSVAAAVENPELRKWSDVAILWQMPLPMILSLICLASNIAVVIGLVKLIGVIPGTARLLHNYILIVQSKVIQISDRLASPFVKVSSGKARLQAGLRALRRK